MNPPVYLDNNASTAVDPRVAEAVFPYFTRFYGNPSSNHTFGWIASEAVELAREKVARFVSAESSEIYFTSGATESINTAIKGVFSTFYGKGKHIITVSTEHKAVLNSCQSLIALGADITFLPVNREGLVDPDDLKKAIRKDTILVSVMYGNNETGVIQPIKEIAAITHEHGVIFMCDATQGAAKVQLDVDDLGIDILALSGHKMYAPKGCGILYLRRKKPRVKIPPLLHGGEHEGGVRSGTLNVPGIVGLGEACSIAEREFWQDGLNMSRLRTRLEQALMDLGEVYINGSTKHRLPNVSSLMFEGLKASDIIKAVPDIALSTGSACSAANPEPSHVLKAMGLSDDMAYATIRFSLGRFTTEEEINYTIEKVSEAVKHLRRS